MSSEVLSASHPGEPYRGGPDTTALGSIPRTPRLVYVALVVASCTGFVLTFALWALSALASRDGPEPAFLAAAAAALVVTGILSLAGMGVGVYWVYRAWAWLPPTQRYAELWRGWITPGEAALLLLVPYFHYYWMFVVSLGLCDALDRLVAVRKPETKQAAPRSIAIAACLSQLLMPLPAGAIMWLFYMTKVERLANALRAPPPTP